MPFLRNISINRKLTIIIMAATAVALLIVSTGFVTCETITFRRSMTRDLSTLAEIIGSQSTAALTYDDHKNGEEILRALSAKERLSGAALYKGNQIFAQFLPDTSHPLPAKPGAAGSKFEKNYLVLFKDIHLGNEKVGTICLRSDLTEMRQRLTLYGGMMVFFTLLSCVVTYFLSSLFQGVITQPISHLAQTAKEISKGKNYSMRAQKAADDEMGELIDGFNQMLSQIQQRDGALQRANDELEKRVYDRTKELQQANEELRQTQQAAMQQERLKALGQMATGIAHDINNALSPIVGFSDLLIRTEAGLSENGKKFLTHIKTSGEDIAQIVARLREFYRQRDEREPLFSVNLNALAEQVIEMTRPRWRDIPQERGLMVKLVTEFDSNLQPLAAKETEVREALINLILNAVDAEPTGGTIKVRTRIVDGSVLGKSREGSKAAVVEVNDTGIGMNEETKKRCLEPFFSTKGKRGTGLGLAMVYGVMERHGGKIEIESEVNQGTTVRLIFPIQKGVPSAAAPEAKKVGEVGPLQILCIDDEPMLRELLKEMLENDGHRVEASDGGLAGLDAFRAAKKKGSPFDVVITDLGMPNIDGRQVARLLKRESPKTPILMLTGWGAFMRQDRDLPTQVDGILSKPPRSCELRQTLQRLTQNSTTEVRVPVYI